METKIVQFLFCCMTVLMGLVLLTAAEDAGGEGVVNVHMKKRLFKAGDQVQVKHHEVSHAENLSEIEGVKAETNEVAREFEYAYEQIFVAVDEDGRVKKIERRYSSFVGEGKAVEGIVKDLSQDRVVVFDLSTEAGSFSVFETTDGKRDLVKVSARCHSWLKKELRDLINPKPIEVIKQKFIPKEDVESGQHWKIPPAEALLSLHLMDNMKLKDGSTSSVSISEIEDTMATIVVRVNADAVMKMMGKELDHHVTAELIETLNIETGLPESLQSTIHYRLQNISSMMGNERRMMSGGMTTITETFNYVWK